MTGVIFEELGLRRYRPTEHAIGPWDRRALHGGAPCALLAGALEQAIIDADLGASFFPARFTAELLRPVPLDELEVLTTIRRPGRRICLADAQLATPDGSVVVRATLQGIRDTPFDPTLPAGPATPPGPDEGRALTGAMVDGPVAFHNRGVEHRYVEGTSFDAPGPATDWIRLRVPLVGGREPTALERVVAAADFGNGISHIFDFQSTLFINPDLTVLLYRLPVGEWVCLDAVTRAADAGVGLAESVLFDETGAIGRAAQTLLLEAR